MISCFFERTLRNVRSFCGSKVRITLLALEESCVNNAACCAVSSLDKVDLIGTPSLVTIKIPVTPRCD